MLSVQDVREETNQPELSEENILKQIKRKQDFLRGYTNNDLLFVAENAELDEVLLYLVSASFNEDVKGRQGLKQESVGGVSFTYIDDLPRHLKRVLSKYTRVRIH